MLQPTFPLLAFRAHALSLCLSLSPSLIIYIFQGTKPSKTKNWHRYQNHSLKNVNLESIRCINTPIHHAVIPFFNMVAPDKLQLFHEHLGFSLEDSGSAVHFRQPAFTHLRIWRTSQRVSDICKRFITNWLERGLFVTCKHLIGFYSHLLVSWWHRTYSKAYEWGTSCLSTYHTGKYPSLP